MTTIIHPNYLSGQVLLNMRFGVIISTLSLEAVSHRNLFSFTTNLQVMKGEVGLDYAQQKGAGSGEIEALEEGGNRGL